MTKNLLILASAGTGKTYALATRYLQLAAVFGVEPGEILALTFSRAAAQEIYEKIASRLVDAAPDETSAAQELARLTENHSRALAPHLAALPNRRAVFIKLLRDIIATQHTGNIATLDSFILRMVRNFPLETGFQSNISILDDFARQDAVREAVSRIAATEDGATRIRAVCAALAPHERPFDPASLVAKTAASKWRTFALDHPDIAQTPPEAIMARLGIAPPPTDPSGSITFVLPERTGDFDALDPASRAPLEVFLQFLRTADGSKSFKPTATDAKAFAGHFTGPDAAENSWTRTGSTGKVLRTYSYPSALADAIRQDFATLKTAIVWHAVKSAASHFAAAALFELSYNKAARRLGMLTFDDLSRFREKCTAAGAMSLENLEYRFDERFSHWALDEFQDTSLQQWASIKSLVLSAADDPDKSVMAVGDRKQAIYGWRGASDTPLVELAGTPSMRGTGADGRTIFSAPDMPIGQIGNLDTSRRYGQNTCNFINAVFGAKALVADSFIDGRFRDAIQRRWLDGFRPHKTEPVCCGGTRPDTIRISAFTPSENAASASRDELEDDAIPANVLAFGPDVKTLLLDAMASGLGSESIALLVRTNEQGRALEAYLKKDPAFNVVWEGAGSILDSPLVNRILDLLRLAENPEDRLAAGAVRLAGISGPSPDTIRRLLSRQGLSRTIRHLARALGNGERQTELETANCNLQTANCKLETANCKLETANSKLQTANCKLQTDKISSLLRMAVNYQAISRADATIADFREYLAAKEERVSAPPGSVRILTIHRSKGLTFDHVVVPVFETSRTDVSRLGASRIISGAGWAMGGIDSAAAAGIPQIENAIARAREDAIIENLNLYYVAFTRHRRSLGIAIDETTGPASISFLVKSWNREIVES